MTESIITKTRQNSKRQPVNFYIPGYMLSSIDRQVAKKLYRDREEFCMTWLTRGLLVDNNETWIKSFAKLVADEAMKGTPVGTG